VKNKVAPPFKQVEFDIMYGEGISKVGELVDLGVKAGVVEKSGAWFSFDSQRLGQGRENAKSFLKANPEAAARIEQAIRENSGLIAERILDAGGDEAKKRKAERGAMRLPPLCRAALVGPSTAPFPARPGRLLWSRTNFRNCPAGFSLPIALTGISQGETKGCGRPSRPSAKRATS